MQYGPGFEDQYEPSPAIPEVAIPNVIPEKAAEFEASFQIAQVINLLNEGIARTWRIVKT
jgi:hypothetical protein